MTLALPHPVAKYFIADAVDGESVAQCFTDGAILKDEGHTYHGRAAIKQWKTDTAAKYQYTCVPFEIELKDGKIIVTSRLTGSFPGSPADLRFCFELEGDQIASLEIVP